MNGKQAYLQTLWSRSIWLILGFLCFYQVIAAVELKVLTSPGVLSDDPFHPDANDFLTHLSYRPLVALDEAKQWRCVLCKEIPTFENQGLRIKRKGAQQQLIARWRLRNDATWSDGRPVTAADFLLAYEVLKKAEYPSVSSLGILHEVEALNTVDNPREFEVAYLGSSREYFRMAKFFPLPAQVYAKIWKECSEQFECFADAARLRFANGPYNGPFTPKMLDGRLSYTANPNFKGAKKLLPTRTISVSTGAQLSMKELQQYDIITEGVLSQSAAIDLQRSIATQAFRDQFSFHFAESSDFMQLAFNHRHPLLSSAKVRQALVVFAQSPTIIQELFAHHQRIPLHFLDAAGWPSIKAPKQIDHHRARLNLKSEGWTLVDGSLSRDKQAFNLEIAVPSDDPTRISIAEQIAKNWMKHGIKASVTKISGEFFRGQFLQRAEFRDAAIFSWKLIPGVVPKSILHSKEIPSFTNHYRGLNISGWHHKEVDQALEKIDAKIDSDDLGLFETVVKATITEAPFMPLYFSNSPSISKRSIGNYQPGSSQRPSSLNAEAWQW
jgi:peptide/nickel transport system substrate-binding protein